MLRLICPAVDSVFAVCKGVDLCGDLKVVTLRALCNLQMVLGGKSCREARKCVVQYVLSKVRVLVILIAIDGACMTPGHKNSCEMVSAVATSDEVVEKKEVVTQVEGRHQGIGHKSLLRSDALYQVHCIQIT